MPSVCTASQCGSTAMGHGHPAPERPPGADRQSVASATPVKSAESGSSQERPRHGRRWSGRRPPTAVWRSTSRGVGLADQPGQGPRTEDALHRDVGPVQGPVQRQHLTGEYGPDPDHAAAGGPDRARRAAGVDGQGQQHPVPTGDRRRFVDQRPVRAAGRECRPRARRGWPSAAAPRCRRRGDRTRSTGSGAPQTPRGPSPPVPAPRPRSRASWSAGPSRAKLWPLTASTAVAVRDGASNTTPTSEGASGCPHGRPSMVNPPKTVLLAAEWVDRGGGLTVTPPGPARAGSSETRWPRRGAVARLAKIAGGPGPDPAHRRAAATARRSGPGPARRRRQRRHRRPPGRPGFRRPTDWTARTTPRSPGSPPPSRSARRASRR